MDLEEWKALKEEFKKDDKKAFKKMYKHLWRRLYAVSYNYVRDKATAREIIQDAFVNLWIKRSLLQSVDDITAYTVRTIKYQIYDYFDKKAVVDRYISHRSQDPNSISASDHYPMEYEETLERITKEIDKLPNTTKKIFVLSRFDQFSNEEIALQLHVSVKTVEYHITKSLKHLRLRLGYIIVFGVYLPFLYAVLQAYRFD